MAENDSDYDVVTMTWDIVPSEDDSTEFDDGGYTTEEHLQLLCIPIPWDCWKDMCHCGRRVAEPRNWDQLFDPDSPLVSDCGKKNNRGWWSPPSGRSTCDCGSSRARAPCTEHWWLLGCSYHPHHHHWTCDWWKMWCFNCHRRRPSLTGTARVEPALSKKRNLISNPSQW